MGLVRTNVQRRRGGGWIWKNREGAELLLADHSVPRLAHAHLTSDRF
jgi:hypothetical protein